MHFSTRHLERNKAIAIKALNGYTMEEVGKEYRLSGARVAQILLNTVLTADHTLGTRMRMSPQPLAFARKYFDHIEPKIRLLENPKK